MTTQNLSTLKIHKLTQAQYDRELAAGRIDENALYLTPDEEIDLTPYATKEEVATKADAEHSHEISDVTDLQSTLDVMEDELRGYTDTKIADLINGAPTTLNTLGEIADAMEENADVVEALDNAIGTKANVSDLISHVNNLTTHITAAERTSWNAIEGKVKTYADGLVADKATVAYVDEQVDGKATIEYVDDSVPLIIDVTHISDATFQLPDEWNFATIQEQWRANRLIALRVNNLLYLCSAVTDSLMRFEVVYEATYLAKNTYLRSHFTLTPDNTFTYYSNIIRHPTYVRFYNSNGVNSLDGYTFDDLNTMIDNNLPVFLYRVFTDNIKYVYHFHKKNVSNGVTSLIFYYQDGLNLYQAIVKSDGGFSNGYYALVASSRTINGKPLSANIVLTPEDIGVETPDWNINDESSAAYIKNRPFYESDNCTVGSYRDGYIQAGANGIKTARLYGVDLPMLEPGATYHISFLEQDSPYAEIASYDWTVKEWDSTSNDPYYVGNPIIYADSGSLGEDSGEPAVLYTRDGAAYMAIDTRREPLTAITGLLNVVISKDAGLKTLDEKYIPDSIARTGHTHNWMDVGSKAYECNGYVIVEPTTFESDGDYMENVFNTFEIINGEVYTVLFDGVEYTTTAVGDGIDITDVFGVGNGYDNTNYTYCAAGTHTVSIYKGYVQATICEDVIIYPYDNYDDIEWFETDVLMSDGETYVVTWDDVEYICLARRDGESVFIGRQSLMKEHGYSGNLPDIGNEPFAIYTTDSGDLGVLRNNQSHTVTVKRATKRVDYSMPVKYLPTHTHTIEDVFELGVNKEIMLEENTATLRSGDLKQYSDWMEISVLPSHGDTCIVTWQGEEYETVAYLEEDRGRIYVGNRHFYSDAEDTGEPFLFLIDAEDYEYRIYTHDELTECTYKAWVQRKAIHPKYIPDTIARKSDLANAMPTVTTADNGKFLRVVDGAWAATTVPRAEDLEV